ncbi:MAG: hypothetical protein ACJ754_08730 [Pyrinomonadaceae bacterium]
MTTNSKIDRRATATAETAAGLTSAPHPGAGERGSVCPSQSAFNHVGGMIQRTDLRPEGWARKDRRQLQH